MFGPSGFIELAIVVAYCFMKFAMLRLWLMSLVFSQCVPRSRVGEKLLSRALKLVIAAGTVVLLIAGTVNVFEVANVGTWDGLTGVNSTGGLSIGFRSSGIGGVDGIMPLCSSSTGGYFIFLSLPFIVTMSVPLKFGSIPIPK